MVHFYVVNGNEYGIDIETKKNFIDIDSAKEYFENVKFDDFVCLLIFVDFEGNEEIIVKHLNN